MRCRSRNKDLVQCELDSGHDDMHTAQDTAERVMLVTRWGGIEQELLAVNLGADKITEDDDDDDSLLVFFSHAIEALKKDGVLETPQVDAEALKAEIVLILENDHFKGLTSGLLAAVLVARMLTELGMEAIDESAVDDPAEGEDSLPV